MFNFEEVESMIQEKSGLAAYVGAAEPSAVPLLKYSKFREKWLYTLAGVRVAPFLDSFSLCLFTNLFNPEKYFALLSLLASLYKGSHSATPLLECYLNVLTTGKASYEGVGTFVSSDYDSKKDHFVASPLLDIVQIFEESSWIIWSALLMKKRIAVYSTHEDILQKIIRAFPLFVLHRQDWNLLRPLVNVSNQMELQDLTNAGVFIAGFTDNIIKQKEDYYDIILDVDNKTVTVANHAKSNFEQTKFHQEFASFITFALEAEEVTDKKLSMAIKKRTGELIARLTKLKEGGYISFSVLSSQKLAPNMEKFLYAVASAEGMTDISSSS